MGIPANLMRARCRFCGRPLRYANLPNRGPVMVHAKGDGETCRRLQYLGRDLVSRAEQDEARKVITSIQRFAHQVRRLMAG